jgi:hypothetical protein
MPETEITIDMLEDYWYDFLLFQREARTASRNRDQLKIHRYLRAGLFSFVHYLTGLVNRWTDENAASPKPPLPDRLADLSQRLGGSPPPRADLEYLTALASRCADLRPADESDLFSALSLDKTEAAERNVLVWLDEFTQNTGLRRHSATRSIGLSFADAFGNVVEESYQAYDAYANDPNAFQDDPRVWGDPVGEGPSGQAHD